jgi:hypothetical protein
MTDEQPAEFEPDTRPTVELVAAALGIARSYHDPDADERHTYWRLVGTLHGRGGSPELDAVCCCLSPSIAGYLRLRCGQQ